ncbi:hypothetical protein H5407_08185 [Mitsuaria sp. WAJ17]|uniref:hypothetical protein n=1 Tax=Mitsuaria sp. WAJ17 TaxID=2761452 RepID=UPI00160252D8|nr:hypothetical protein [Mitsuaria sp. WAJ17]MBB2485210.1 hypothetical protein [Mitsuaria sp. WAJ17]
MSKSPRLQLSTTSVRSLSSSEVGQVAGADGGPTGNTSLSNAYCGPCPSNNPCQTNYCPPPATATCPPATTNCPAPTTNVTKGWCI